MTVPRQHTIVAVVHGSVALTVPPIETLGGWSVHLPHPDEPAVQPEGVGGVVTAWVDGDALPDPAAWFEVPVTAYLVEARVQIEWPDVAASRDGPIGAPTRGIEQISFVRRLPSLRRAEFVAHWRERHTPLVPVHHPGVARYVQNVVIEPLTPSAPEVDGIAELSFATVHDFHERYNDSDEGMQIVRADVARFIDRPQGWRMTAQEFRLVR